MSSAMPLVCDLLSVQDHSSGGMQQGEMEGRGAQSFV